METTARCYHVDRREISFIKFVLEAYDNVAVLSTVDPHQGFVRIRIAPGCEELVDGIVHALSETVEMINKDECDGIAEDVLAPE